MKPDTYTKTVLTIIAVCMLIIAGRNIALVPPAQAADLGSVSYGMVPLNEDGSMNVRVVGMPETVDVNITECAKYAFKYVEPLAVAVDGQVEVTGSVRCNN